MVNNPVGFLLGACSSSFIVVWVYYSFVAVSWILLLMWSGLLVHTQYGLLESMCIKESNEITIGTTINKCQEPRYWTVQYC